MFRASLPRWFVFNTRRPTRRTRAGDHRSRFRPRLERLEDRTLPSTVAVIGQAARFGLVDQTVGLAATVTDSSGTVNEGTVTFAVFQGTTQIGSSITSGTVGNGSATAKFTLPGGTLAGGYTIDATYNPGPDFTAGSGVGDLTVNPANTNTEAFSQDVSSSPTDQSVTLSAQVTGLPSVIASPVNEGLVTFTVFQGSTQIGNVATGPVKDGTATATYTLPGGTAQGTYVIQATYEGSHDYQPFSSERGWLAVLPPGGPFATNLTAANHQFPYQGNGITVGVSATVTSTAGMVNEGTVTFALFQGTQQIGDTVSATPVNNNAGADIPIPAGLPVGTYNVVATYNPGPHFTGSQGQSTITVTPAPTSTTAANQDANVSSADQSITLSATLWSVTSGKPNEGTVTFAVFQGSTQIGSSVTSGAVSAGSASATYTLPGGTPSGTYTIQATYNPGPDFTGSSDNTHTLTVHGSLIATATAAANASMAFGSKDQVVPLSATVTSGFGPVDEGTVTFAIFQGSTQIGSSVTSGTVTNGTAGANFTLPGGTAAGTYTIQATYNPGPDFIASSDTSHTLAVQPAATTLAVDDHGTLFSPSQPQSQSLSAQVFSSGGPVNEGTVTFAIFAGSTPIGSSVSSGTVSDGTASALSTVPAGTPAGAYSIHATYNPGPDFTGSSDNAGSFTVNPAPTHTNANNQTATFSSADQSVTLSATVVGLPVSNEGPVNEGTVTFAVFQGSTQIGASVTSGTVTNGSASVTYTLPGGTAPGTYTIQANYNGGHDYQDDSQGGTFTRGTLTVAPASTRIAGTSDGGTSMVATTFRSTDTTVAVRAYLFSNAGRVNEGTVTFTVTVIGGTTPIGSSVTAPVNPLGIANTAFTIPGGTPVGAYNIHATYNPGPDFTGSSGNIGTLLINAATTTSAADQTATFSSSNQTLTLSAVVSPTPVSATGSVNQGTVTFAVFQGTKQIGSSVISGTVSNGAASATYTLPGGTPAGTYTIHATYNPDGPSPYEASSDNTYTLTVQPTGTTLSAADQAAAFSRADQSVTLSATVASGAGAVNEGTVTFSVFRGNTQIGTSVTSATVSGGNASASYTLPGGSLPGKYFIHASYNPGPDFTASSDDKHRLSVSAAPPMAAGSQPGSPAVVNVTDQTGKALFQLTPFGAFTGGVNTAVVDVNGVPEIIAAAGPGGGPDVKVYDANTGALLREFFAFAPGFTGGVNVAAGNGNGNAVFAVSAGPGGGPQVNVYNAADGSLRAAFFAYDPRFTGGVRVAVGDVNGDGTPDVITGAGPGGGPQVRVFDGATAQALASYFAFDPRFSGGIYVAAADVNHAGRADVIVGAGAGGGPDVAVLNGLDGSAVLNFLAYDSSFTHGVRVAAADVNGDGVPDIVTNSGTGPAAKTHAFSAADASNLDQFFASNPRFGPDQFDGGS